MPDFDLFNFFRWVLGTVVTIYATVVTFNSLLGWYNYLTQPGQVMTLLGRYVLVHGLRLRLVSFCGDLLICLLLCVIFVMLLHAHGIVFDIGRDFGTGTHWNNVRQSVQLPHRAGV